MADTHHFQPERLYRSRTERRIWGVCGGIAEYFNIDPVIVRLIWILFTLAGGAGIITYIVAYLLVPEKQESSV
jgi:phage shock protein C